MSCDETNLSAYLDGELTDADRRSVEAHLRACPDCTAALKDLERVRTMLLTQAIPMGLHEPVIDRIRREEAVTPSRGSRRLVWAVAAVVLIALLAAAVFQMMRASSPGPGDDRSPAFIVRDDGRSQEEAPVIVAQEPPQEDSVEPQKVQPEPLAETDLPLTLAGTLLGADPQAVIVSRESGTQRSYRPGDTVLPGVVVQEIQQGCVVLDNAGTLETLSKGLSGSPERPSLNGRWQVAYLLRDQLIDYGPFVNISEADGALTISVEGEDATFPGRVDGRRLTVDGTSQNMPADLQGDFNSAFTEVVLTSPALNGFPQDNQIVTDEDRYSIKLTKISADSPARDERAIFNDRQAELKAMYEPLRRFADAHDGRFPDALAQLIPDYVADLELYANRADKTVEYYPGNVLLDVSSLPEIPGCSQGGDVAQALLDYETELTRIWGGPAPFIQTLLVVTYKEPDYRFTVNTQGAVSGRSLHPALEMADTSPAVAQARLSAQIASDQNNLKQLGLVMKMFQNEHCDFVFPGWCSVYPEYLTDPNILTSPWDEPGTVSYEILFPAVAQEELVALGTEFFLAEGAEDVNSPAFNARAQSVVPIIFNAANIPAVGGNPATRNVLFLDGHVQRLTLDEFAERVGPFLR